MLGFLLLNSETLSQPIRRRLACRLQSTASWPCRALMTARSTLMVRSADPTIRSHLEACRRISVTVMAGRRHSSAGQRSESR